ncbi:hypothetical protein NHE_0035 [Neorickettsia helminthoeca str. Oregon]|uniref:Uncharacterized protein n=1 Tax=Neorickettsia helminthoeca str. Oregon TaxID=1286528 RepID=X5HL08_9RICK|nr:DUF4040 domain-containing protein [Neorickettsia helminthoeca]AHX11010.1 hypothetical protein NHE_0035 [Neorickettsia helminthoeca str. Oregon]
MELVIIKVVLLLGLVLISIALAATEDLLTEVVYSGIISLLLTLMYMTMNAADVAITESAVGSYVTTVFILLVGMVIDKKNDPTPTRSDKWLALLASVTAGCALVCVTYDLPTYGLLAAPANNEIYKYYLENTESLFGFPNVVTAILAGFRGYDTMIETVVVFTAAFSLIFLLSASEKDDK